MTKTRSNSLMTAGVLALLAIPFCTRATPPEIIAQPQSVTNAFGALVSFSVTATNLLPLSYQWWKDNLVLPDATNDTYSLASVSLTNAGAYFVIVTNNYGSVTSAVATLTVTNAPVVTGDNGNNTLFLQAEQEQLTMTITNAYSGEVLSINDLYNVNIAIYDGLGGYDTLLLSNAGDFIALRDGGGNQTLFNMENIVAGNGGDIINLSDLTIVLGDISINGGSGDDILWGNAGNDTIQGLDGNDRINGGPGNDILSGGNGNDILDGSSGNDTVTGDAGDDTLIYTAAGNAGTTNNFDGGSGTDTLILRLTPTKNAIAAADIAAAQTFITNNYDPAGTNGPGYTFSSFNLTFSNIEVLKVEVIVTGDNGNDTLNFQGTQEQLAVTITNAYSGEVLTLNGSYNVNTAIYNGLGGIDTLNLTSTNDFLAIRDGDGNQTLFSVERIIAGDGNDVINLSDPTIVIPDASLYANFINGGAGDDILWGNAGGDVIEGFQGNDNIIGGPGNNILNGGDGNDIVEGGTGTNIVTGDAGDDTLIYTAAGNPGATNNFDGGSGTDTLILRLTSMESNAAAADIAAARTFITNNYDPAGTNGPGYTFSSFNLTFSNIEVLQVELTDSNAVITLSPDSPLPDGLVGSNYSQTISASGGTAPYTFSVTSGSLPGGLDLSGAGSLSGTPTNQGIFNFTITATDSNGYFGSLAYTLAVFSPPEITAQPQSVTNLTGTTASFVVTAAGTDPLSYQWRRVGTNLFDGGNISGTTTNELTLNNVQFADAADYDVVITNSYGSVTSLVATLTVVCPDISLAPGSLPDGTNGVSYAQTITASGGLAPYTFALTGGALPGGINLASGGDLSGTPTNTGPFNFTVTATDADACTGSSNYSLMISCPAIALNPPTLPDGVAGSNYDQTLTANGGLAPYDFAVTGGALPGGLMLSAAGALSGTLTNSGNFNFTVTATDTNGCMGSLAYNLSVVCPVIALNPTNLPDAVAGTAYDQSLTADGGIAPYNYLVTSGALPGGLDLSGAGGLSGTPTNTGTFNFTVTATDAIGCAGGQAYELMVFGPPQITAQPEGVTNLVGTTVNFVVTASGTDPLNYQWRRSGTNLSDVGNISGATTNTLTLTDVQTAEAADYDVVITNNYGSVTSLVATLTVTNEPGIDIVWVSVVSGNWGDAANWSPNQVPGPLDTASIAKNVTVTVGSPAVVSNLMFASATLAGSSVLTVNGTMNWTNGTLSSPLTLEPESQLNISSTGTHIIYGVITNRGTVTWTNAAIYGYSGAIYNEGLWQMEGDLNLILGSGTNTFLNTGTFQKAGGAGVGTIGWDFTTTGWMDVTNGSLSLSRWTGTNVLQGVLNWSGGTLNGSLLSESNAVLNWTGGSIGAATAILEPGSQLNISSTDGHSIYGVITNRGTVTWTNAIIYGYSAAIYNEGLWQMDGEPNLSRGLGTNTFLNTGTFRKASGTGIGIIGWDFTTTGWMDVTNGSLALSSWTGTNVLQGVLNWSGGTLTGSLLSESNGVINWISGTMGAVMATLEPGSQLNISSTGPHSVYGVITNQGTITWTNATLYGYSAAIFNEGLWQMEGEPNFANGSGNNTFLNTGTFQKSSGTGTGTIGWDFTTTGWMDVTNGSLTLSSWTGTNVLQGVLNWVGNFNAVLLIETNGLLVPYGTASHSIYGVITNRGTVVWSNGSIYGYSGAIYNEGLWQMDGDLNLVTGSGNNTFLNTGTFQKTSGTGTGIVGWGFSTSGQFDLLAGTLSLSGITQQTGGTTSLKTGRLGVSQPFQLLGGALNGTNTLTGSVTNNAVVAPGASPGKLTITGAYTQTTNGVLQIELAGYAAGTSFDQLAVGGAAKLDGNLSITLLNGFIPTNNSTFTFLTAGSRTGAFAGVTLPPQIGATVNYAATSVTLQITNVQAVITTPVLVYGPLLTNGDFVARFLGATGTTYTIERTPVLSPADWLKWTNLLAPSVDEGNGAGVFELRDPINASTNRFYRAVYPAY